MGPLALRYLARFSLVIWLGWVLAPSISLANALDELTAEDRAAIRQTIARQIEAFKAIIDEELGGSAS